MIARRGTLLVVLLGGISSAAGQSLPVRPDELTLDEIVVTDDPEPEAGVHTVTREAVERSGAKSVAEVLAQEPTASTTTGRRGEHLFSLRGFEQREVVVLIDGAPANLPYDGQVDLGVLPAEMIDHLTVARGPTSVLFGPNGMGGAVNLVTRRAGTGPLVALTAETGREDALRLSGVHAAKLGRLGYTVFGGLQRRAAFPLPADFAPVPRENGVRRENSDSAFYHAGTSLALALGRGHLLSANFAYLDGARGVPPGLMEPVIRYWRFNTWRSGSGSLGHSATYRGGALAVDEQLFFRLYDNLLDSYDDATYSTQQSSGAFHSWYHDQLMGGRVRASYRFERAPWGPTHLRLWAGAQHDRHDEDPDGTLLTRSLLTVAPEVEAFLGERWSLTVALQLDAELPGTTDSSHLGWGPLLAARFDPLPVLSLQATAARRTRFPTLRERDTTALGSRVPNPDLQPESAWHVALDASWRGPRGLQLLASCYDAEVLDLIDLVKLGGGQEQLQNISRARLLGAELSLELPVWRWLAVRGAYAFLHARRLAPNEELSYRPSHKSTLALVMRPLSWVELDTQLRVVGPRAFQHPASGAWAELPAYATWDVRLAVSPQRWLTAWLQGTNLLDSSYETEFGYPEAGRELWVGLRVSYERELLRLGSGSEAK